MHWAWPSVTPTPARPSPRWREAPRSRDGPTHSTSADEPTEIDRACGPPNELQPGLTRAELLKALEGGKALRAASLTFRFWQ